MVNNYSLEVVDTIDGSTLLARGDIDMVTAPYLLDAIVSAGIAGGDPVTLDLEGVTFLDSSGLSALIEAKRCFDRLPQTLCVVNVPPVVQGVLAITGLEAYLEVEVSDPDRSVAAT